MKTVLLSNSRSLHRALCTLLIGAAALWAMPTSARAQQLYVSDQNAGTVGEYNAATGAAINANLVPGLNDPGALALSGNDLFVANQGNGTVGEYNATTGAAINANFITGLTGPGELAVSGNALFVSNGGIVSEYNATTGATVNAHFIAAPFPFGSGLAVSGNALFVTMGGGVSEYNATTGAAINANFITGLAPAPVALAASGNALFVADTGNSAVFENNVTTGGGPSNFMGISTVPNVPSGLAVSGNTLFVGVGMETYPFSTVVGEYNATTGAATNASFITGLTGPVELAVGAVPAVPEASPWAMMAGCGVAWLGLMLRKKCRTA